MVEKDKKSLDVWLYIIKARSQKQNQVHQEKEEINVIFKHFVAARLCLPQHPIFKLLVWSRQEPDGSVRMTGNYCKLNQMVLLIVAEFLEGYLYVYLEVYLL